MDEQGFGAGVTCETLGYFSITTIEECNQASKKIDEVSDLIPYSSGELTCSNYNPNHCFFNANSKTLYFTGATCGIHGSKADPPEGIICRTRGAYLCKCCTQICQLFHLIITNNYIKFLL